MHRVSLFLIYLFVYSIITGCKNEQKESVKEKPQSTKGAININYSVVNTFPHDTSLFTEGLLIHDGLLLESTGSPREVENSRSLIGTIDLQTWKFNKKIELDKSQFFGEGIVVLDNKLYQLTYKNQVGFIYDAKSFKRLGTFSYNNKEGWGFTTDGSHLIMSDGTDKLTFLNPTTLQPAKTLNITDNRIPLKNLNELEYIKGFIYANIWKTNQIVKINPLTGAIVGKLDLSSIANDAMNKNPNSDVLNGIAYDSLSNKIYITGKFWSQFYQIEFAH